MGYRRLDDGVIIGGIENPLTAKEAFENEWNLLLKEKNMAIGDNRDAILTHLAKGNYGSFRLKGLSLEDALVHFQEAKTLINEEIELLESQIHFDKEAKKSIRTRVSDLIYEKEVKYGVTPTYCYLGREELAEVRQPVIKSMGEITSFCGCEIIAVDTKNHLTVCF